MSFRTISESEYRLLVALLGAVPECRLDPHSSATLLVEPMDDGGMGSLRLADRKGLSFPAAELQFRDADGVLVIATLYVDSDKVPVEVGVWKVNFAPLGEIPVELPTAKRCSMGNEPD